MKNFGGKFALIAVTTLAGLLALWPPDEKLKLGIDLSGGTILVYEVAKGNLPSNFNMDELIAVAQASDRPAGRRARSRSARSAATASRSSCPRPPPRRSRRSSGG